MSSPTREDITVTKLIRGKEVQVEGQLITTGLALTPLNEYADDRYSITHIPSGKAVVQGYCLAHAEEVAQLLAAVDIDWTVPADELVKVQLVRDAAQNAVTMYPPCLRRCGSGPSWQVRCNTCDWVYELDDDGPLDAKEAKRAASYHECEPDVEIAKPDSGTWHATWQVEDDGTVRGAS